MKIRKPNVINIILMTPKEQEKELFEKLNNQKKRVFVVPKLVLKHLRKRRNDLYIYLDEGVFFAVGD